MVNIESVWFGSPLARTSRQKIWQKGMKKAGRGPVTWHELRARTRHRG